MAGQRELGRLGEDRAANYLRLHGYKIIDRNWSCRYGEIDIIASKRGYIVFAEVKLRRDDSHGEAREFVTYSKQQKVIAAAQMYLAQNDTDLQPRFDVLELYAPNGENGRISIEHIENAFECEA